MKSFDVNKKSWHYRLAHTYGFFHEYHRNTHNICDYTKAVLKGALSVALLSGLVGVALTPFSDVFVWIYAMLKFGMFIEPSLAVVGLTLLVSGAFAFLMYCLHFVFAGNSKSAVTLKESIASSFIGKAYVSWKEKYCLPIKLVDK